MTRNHNFNIFSKLMNHKCSMATLVDSKRVILCQVIQKNDPFEIILFKFDVMIDLEILIPNNFFF